MNKYSNANLLAYEYLRIGRLRDRLFHKFIVFSNTYLTIELPRVVYHRADSFCHDVYRKSGWDFQMNDLMQLRLTDFVSNVQKYSDPKDLHDRLTAINYSKKFYVKGKEESSFPVMAGFYQDDCIELKNLKFDSDDVLRSEYALLDMECAFPHHEMTVEKVISSLICDFVRQIQTNGRGVLEDVIQSIEKEWVEK